MEEENVIKDEEIINEELLEEDTPVVVIDDTVTKLESQVKEYLDAARRIQAEFDNYRKRNNESVKVARENGIYDVVSSVLAIKDTIEIALKMINDKSALEGVILINKQIDSLLTKYDVAKIDALNQEFNPEYHNAIMKVEDAENAGKVVEVLQEGYLIGKKVLRYAVVKVAV